MKNPIFKKLEELGGLLLGLMALLVIFQVITRYVFNFPPPWTEELARYMMIWSTLIISAVLTFDKAHINMDYFINLVPFGIKKALSIISGVAIAGFLLVFVISAMGLIQTSLQITQRSVGMGIPMVFVYIILPFAGIAMLIAHLTIFSGELKSLFSSRNKAAEFKQRELKD